MQSIIAFSELRSFIYSQKYDTYQTIIESFIRNDYFPWVCLILLFNRKNWKRPITIILIVHWFLRSIGDSLNNLLPLRPWVPNTYWPYTNENWFICCALANVFWLSGEIVGDWYALLRTKAVTNNNKKVRLVYVTVIIYNLVKCLNMYCNFMDLPFDLRLQDEEGNLVKDIARFKIHWWSIVSIMQVASFLYDLSVIFALKKCLFNKLEQYQGFSGNTFLNKFKQVSEFRIIISMIASIAFLPFVGLFLYYVIHEYHSDSAVSYIPSDETVDYLRRVVLNFNYTLMYIDQILLKSISESKSQPKVSYGANSSNNSSYHNININQNDYRKNSNSNISPQSIISSNNASISVPQKVINNEVINTFNNNYKAKNSNEDLSGMYFNNDNNNNKLNYCQEYKINMTYSNNLYSSTNINNYKFQNNNMYDMNDNQTFVNADDSYNHKKVFYNDNNINNKPSNAYYIKLKNSENLVNKNNYNKEASLSSPSSYETLYNDSNSSININDDINYIMPPINNNIIVKDNGNNNDKLLFKKRNEKCDSIYDLYSQQSQQKQY
ncbi:hypothetical protein BCR36DRAFT_355631 [Piromyces finnis]|uniref:Uncharacterized protein n=1 Tax=Piromyces finnis TaxID=1754191 RepID=A0A1Y1V5D7_9FUNG|nr:hypothetical protein BCR36DRAFT_355631 [Piromyces finnis]|eukprot:ORX47604.1 hypothetical protein BCR36DRAFT_355631 [Piromyces finnis]